MTVKELLRLLEREDPNAEVQMVYQPNYPLVTSIAGIASDAEVAEIEDDHFLEPVEDRAAKKVVYVVEGEWLSYGPHAAWRVARR